MSAENHTAPAVYREIPEATGYRFGSDGSPQSCWIGGRYPAMGADWWPVAIQHKPNGIREIKIRIGGEWTTARLHEMTCWAHRGPRPPGHECAFLDGNRGNLDASNLEWRCPIAEAIAAGVEFREIGETPGYRYGSDGSAWSAWGSGHKTPSDVWQRLELSPAVSGHLRVQVKWDGLNRVVGVHHLIARAFHGPCPPGMECCHKDGIPDHNEPGNLYWGTPKQNTADQFVHGVFACGERSPRATFTEDEVREIRRRYAAGESCGQIARSLNRSRATIKSIAGGFSWKHVS